MSQIKDEEGGKDHGDCSTKKIKVGDEKDKIGDSEEAREILRYFEAYATELDDKHNRFERIIKFGRDITIESKRIIFLLHTIDKKGNQESVLHEADMRLQKVAKTLFKSIAQELQNRDPYLYLKAYRNGLEEYIEAVTFYQYLKCGKVKSWAEIQKTLSYKEPENNIIDNIQVIISPYEYILGIADLTGELMRLCINDLATGDTASCNKTCNFVRDMYKGFVGCAYVSNRLLNRKLCTLEKNLHKMENVCYTIKVRGSEIPKHMLVDLVGEEYVEGDESYHVY